ncbi:hypothetical protein HPB48_010563 [Haemaphysalis longicornis]|uniref:Uncharacterized protein n=1 Tax=Haemaphysalis longicornis TaxID=44386 RepID=A0A9J6H3Y7_HAELO|nr:hypothetical protein HPB48_010563 [Haemaphysalis longicornis]
MRAHHKAASHSQAPARKGCRMCRAGHHSLDSEYLPGALTLDRIDHRHFGNRYCCFFVGECERALEDADIAISLELPQPTRHFYTGILLCNLHRHRDARKPFEKTLDVNTSCNGAVKDVRVRRITLMGYAWNQASGRGKIHDNVTADSDGARALFGRTWGIRTEPTEHRRSSFRPQPSEPDDRLAFRAPENKPRGVHEGTSKRKGKAAMRGGGLEASDRQAQRAVDAAGGGMRSTRSRLGEGGPELERDCGARNPEPAARPLL